MVNFFKLLTKKRNARLLEYILQNPSQKVYAAQLVKRLKMAKKSMLDALWELEAESFIIHEQVGRVKSYSLDKGNPMVKYAKILLSISSILPYVKRISEKDARVYLFGSAARGENDEKSDLDIIFIGEIDSREVAGIFRDFPKVKPLVFSPMEYSQLYRQDKAFYERIEKDKIRLV